MGEFSMVIVGWLLVLAVTVAYFVVLTLVQLKADEELVGCLSFVLVVMYVPAATVAFSLALESRSNGSAATAGMLLLIIPATIGYWKATKDRR